MRAHTHRPCPPSRPAACRLSSQAGFNLIQVMLSMAIGSIVISGAIPRVKEAELESRATIVVNDFRSFATAFETYAQEKGGWPAETSVGVMPPEMADRLGSTSWLRQTPMGGKYNWESDQTHGGVRIRAALSISATEEFPMQVNGDLLLMIDRLIDDGNLTTGMFRTGVDNDPVFIIQQ